MDRKIGKFLSGKKDVSGADAPVNLIHLEDCIEVVKRIIDRNIGGEIFNAVCDGHPMRRELYVKAALKMNAAPPQFSKEVAAGSKIVSNAKLKSFLNYQFKYSDPLNCI